MNTKILLIRHGQSIANIQHFFSGQTDVPLTELGIKQAELAARALEGVRIDKIYSSPLSRAYNTALPFAKSRGLDVNVEKDLIEWDAGDWEGVSFDDIIKKFPEEYHYWKNDMVNLTMPNGESAMEVTERFGKALDKIASKNPNKVILIACHGGVIKTVPSYFAQFDKKIFNDTPVPKNCSLTEIVYENGVGSVVRYSDESHLGELKSEAFII